MFNNKVHLEAKGAEDRKYSLVCDPKSPKGEVFDALSKMMEYVVRLMQEDLVKQKPEEKEEEQPQEENATN